MRIRRKGVCAVLASVVLLVLGSVGCTSIGGGLVPNSRFVYPNSNVKTLGPVKAEVLKFGVLVPPSITLEEMKKVYNDALSQASGANAIVNMREDTTVTFFVLPIYTIKYRLEGEAAHMEVGRQILK